MAFDEITIEDLQQYQDMIAVVRSTEEEIRMVRESSSHPDSNSGGKSSVRSAGNPTHVKAMRIVDLEAKLDRYRAKMKAVEDFTENIEDDLIRSIIRWHYIIGKSWGQTSVIMYGYHDKDICRKMVSRWFKEKL